MASGNSRTRSSISPIRLDCSIRVYLNFALRKQEKLNNLLPQFFCVYTNRHLIDTYSSFCVIAGGEIFFRIVMFCQFLSFFFCSTGYVYSITSLTLSDSSTKFKGNQISRYESYPIFLVCIKRCAIASLNLLSRYKPPPKLVSKKSHPHLAARLIENENNSKQIFSQKLEIISSMCHQHRCKNSVLL